MKEIFSGLLGLIVSWGMVCCLIILIGICFGVDITILQATGGYLILLLLQFIKGFLK